MKIKSIIIAAGAVAALALPIATQAQAQPLPQYASTEEQIRGTIASIGDKYTVYVRDERGFVDTVRLHDGTIINPTGLTLASGQSVTILGRADGKAFDANEIDTPYTVDDGGYAAVDVAPYPYYAYYPAYALSYPAFISLGFGFGGGYYGGGYYGHPGYYGRGYYGYNGYNRGGYGSRYPLAATYRGSTAGYHGTASAGFRASASSSAHVSGGGGFHGGGGSHH